MANRQLRYADLKARGIVRSWTQLKQLQQKHNFPLGKMLTPNCRAWDEIDDIDAWLATRPAENTRPLQGRAKTRHELKRQHGEAEATNNHDQS